MRRQIWMAALTILGMAAGVGSAKPGDGNGDAPDAKLTQGSVWVGTIHPDDRQANGKNFGARLKITSRDGHTFQATFFQTGKNGRASLELDGEVADNGQLKLKPTRVASGEWGGHVLDKVWFGQVKGDDLKFKVLTEGSSENSQGRQCELTLKS